MKTLLGLYPPLHQEAWYRLKMWYWADTDLTPPPTWVTLERITTEQVGLCSYIPPPRANIPISVEPFPVDDSVPTED